MNTKPETHGNMREVSDLEELINKLKKELIGIANGDWRSAVMKAKIALEENFADGGKSQSHGNVFVATSKQAERIRELEEQRKVMGFLLNEAVKDLETEQAEKRELYAMLSHLVDWSPELPYYTKDEYKTLFKNALAAARELLKQVQGEGGQMSAWCAEQAKEAVE